MPDVPTLAPNTPIPGSVSELLSLFGPSSKIAEIAKLGSGEQIAGNLGVGGSGEFFDPINTNEDSPLGKALKDIHSDFTFRTDQAQDIFNLGTSAARQKFGVGARGIKTGMIGIAQSIQQQAAVSGFAGSGQKSKRQAALSRAGSQGISDLFGTKSLVAEGAGIQQQGAIFGAGQSAQSALRDILSTVAGRVADMTSLAAQIRAQGGGGGGGTGSTVTGDASGRYTTGGVAGEETWLDQTFAETGDVESHTITDLLASYGPQGEAPTQEELDAKEAEKDLIRGGVGTRDPSMRFGPG